jgi:2-C-methyl-D-erythritol 4-phosphate cytidylyltransferase
MTTAAVVLAAGAGVRLGEAVPKAFVLLGGRPIVEYSLAAIEASGVIDRTVLVVSNEQVERARGLVADLSGVGRVDAVVAGGQTRQASVRCGLASVEGVDVVLCHDAARPFASPALFARVVEGLASTGAHGVVPVVSSPDTIKRVADGRVIETIPRETVGLVQTPQAFLAEILRRAHDQAALQGIPEATDDAMLVEAIGSPVAVVEGETSNFKITGPNDLRRAEGLIATGQGTWSP